VIILPLLIFPFTEARPQVRGTISAKKDDIVEIYRDGLLEICEKWDVKGLYQKAWAG